MRTILNARKRDLITVKVSGADALCMVMEIGKRDITLYNMCTGRLARVRNPRPVRVPAVSPIVTETTEVMNKIMDVDTAVDAVMNILNKVM